MERTRERVVEAFPELKNIRDAALREKVVAVWLHAWQESAWANLEDAPYNALAPQFSLVAHINQVTAGALDLARQSERWLGGSADEDVIRAAGLLHDVSKLVEYERDGDGYRKSKLGRNFQHAVYGAHLALLHGVPTEVVAIIINHTNESRTLPRTVEGLCIYFSDLCAADVARLMAGAPPLTQK